MFQGLTNPKPDSIFAIGVACSQDTRPNKIDLSIGIYRNERGTTPIMAAVREALVELARRQPSKAYLPLTGNENFNMAIKGLLLRGTAASDRATVIQTPGASGALRMLADLVKQLHPDATIWISSPSYANHRPVIENAGLKLQKYPYYSAATNTVDEAAMLAQVEQLGQSDVLLLHGCCHNPTGSDISLAAWSRIAELANANGFLPFVDIAYQGLADGVKEDAAGLQILANSVEEMMIATSCSKNFGLYRERTGAAILVGKTMQEAMNARGRMLDMALGSHVMAPDHGAAIVSMILNNSRLRDMWQAELTEMSVRLNHLRKLVASEFRAATGSDQFDYFEHHNGLFSYTGLDEDKIARLRQDHAIYLVTGGRVNVAGLNERTIGAFVQAFIAVGACE